MTTVMAESFDFSKIKTLKDLRKLREKELRDKLVYNLLMLTKDYDERVEIWHGSSEYGIDLFFTKKDRFGEIRNFGVQVKAKNITMSEGKKNHDVKIIVGQLLLALSKPVFPPNKPEDPVKLDGFYVITSGRANRNALDTIGYVSKILRNCYFIDGAKLLEIIRRMAALKPTEQL